jgi:nucleoside-diphosphate kinase
LKEKTLSLIKPDAVAAGKAGRILARIEDDGFRIVALRLVRLSRIEAGKFYEIHKQRPFYDGLCEFMSSGPCLALLLERDGAVARLRDLMGATDPGRAEPGSIRKDFGDSIVNNAIHGADSAETARIETRFFFSGLDLLR